MKKKYIKLYDAIFPVWILLLWPKLWLAVLPANFLIGGCSFDAEIPWHKRYYAKYQKRNRKSMALWFSS